MSGTFPCFLRGNPWIPLFVSVCGKKFPFWGWLLGVVVLLLGSGCSYQQRNVLFKDKSYNDYYRQQRKETHAAVIRLKPVADTVARYRLAPGESFSLRFVNFSPQLLTDVITAAGITVTAGGLGGQAFGSGQDANIGGLRFTLDEKGFAALPFLGNINLNNLTLEETRELLKKRYAEYAVNGDLFITPTTLRVTILGETSTQQLLFLPREFMHLTEVLALAGGIPYEARTRKVLIVRGDLNDPQLIWVNLQSLQALSQDDLILQHQDIIYLEPRPNVILGRELGLYSAIFGAVNVVISVALLLSL